MITKDDLITLSGNKKFGQLLEHILACREDCITEMQSADTAKLQQISGKIIAYDEVLRITDAAATIARTRQMP